MQHTLPCGQRSDGIYLQYLVGIRNPVIAPGIIWRLSRGVVCATTWRRHNPEVFKISQQALGPPEQNGVRPSHQSLVDKSIQSNQIALWYRPNQLRCRYLKNLLFVVWRGNLGVIL